MKNKLNYFFFQNQQGKINFSNYISKSRAEIDGDCLWCETRLIDEQIEICRHLPSLQMWRSPPFDLAELGVRDSNGQRQFRHPH